MNPSLTNEIDIRPAITSILNEYKETLERLKERKKEFYTKRQFLQFFEQKGSIEMLENVISEFETVMEIWK